MRHPLLVVLTTLLLSYLGGCATPPKPAVDYDATHDFSTDKTIGFYALSGKITGDNPMDLTDFQKKRIDEALAKALKAKGFTVVDDAKSADLWLSWHLNTIEKQDIRTTTSSPAYMMPMTYGRYNRYAMYSCFNCFENTEVHVKDYTQGTFILDMIDPEKGQSIWRSVTQSKLKGEALKSQTNIDKGAELILSGFPPGAGN